MDFGLNYTVTNLNESIRMTGDWLSSAVLSDLTKPQTAPCCNYDGFNECRVRSPDTTSLIQ